MKNLHPKVSSNDLSAIFGHLSQQPKIRMMTGRMRGQAFVEFDCETIMTGIPTVSFPCYNMVSTPSQCSHTHTHSYSMIFHLWLTSLYLTVAVDIAIKALEMANGYLVRDKPLIICYGRGKTS